MRRHYPLPVGVEYIAMRAFEPLRAIAVASSVIAVWTLPNSPVFYKQGTNFIEQWKESEV